MNKEQKSQCRPSDVDNGAVHGFYCYLLPDEFCNTFRAECTARMYELVVTVFKIDENLPLTVCSGFNDADFPGLDLSTHVLSHPHRKLSEVVLTHCYDGQSSMQLF